MTHARWNPTGQPEKPSREGARCRKMRTRQVVETRDEQSNSPLRGHGPSVEVWALAWALRTSDSGRWRPPRRRVWTWGGGRSRLCREAARLAAGSVHGALTFRVPSSWLCGPPCGRALGQVSAPRPLTFPASRGAPARGPFSVFVAPATPLGRAPSELGGDSFCF